MIHCTIEDLLSVRGGEGTAWARRHLGECALCQQQLDALHQRVAGLKALPSLNPPRDRWPAVREAVLADRHRKRMGRARWVSAALAASVGTVLLVRSVQRPPADMAIDAAPRENLQTLVTQSQQLEAALRAYQPENRVLNGAVAGAVAELEDRIAAIDARLDQPEEWSASQDDVMDLWRRRVELMQGLVNVHVTRAAYLGM